jgi:hypothetical protein
MKKGALIKNRIIKNIFSAVAVAIFGFILLNLAFLFDALFQGLIDGIIKIFTPVDINMAWHWFPPIKHLLFVVLIGIISLLIFKSKLRIFFKATYMIVPLAVVFVTIGMFLYRWPIAVYSLSILFTLSILYYFYCTKKPWLYYYALILIAFVLLIVSLLGVEI